MRVADSINPGDLGRFETALVHILKGDDRATAIVVGALIEDALEQMHRFHFRGDAKPIADLLGRPEEVHPPV